MTLRADRLLAGAAEEIAAVVSDLRRVEAALLPELAAQPPLAALQTLDCVLQRLEGLSKVLAAEAAHLPLLVLPDAVARIEALRLARLADALLQREGESEGPKVELF